MKRHKGVTKLAPQKYQVRVRVTDPRTGERKEVKRVVSGPLEHALTVQKEIETELTALEPRKRVKLEEYANRWLAHRRPTIKPSTMFKYENDLKRHILPSLGSVYVDALRPRDITEYVAKQLAKYAGWSVANRVRLLRIIAKDALADGLTDLDFCARVRLPKGKTYSAEDPNCLTAPQLDRVAQAIPERWYPLFATMAFTGLRWGEVSGLRWTDIDHENGIIIIQRNNWKGVIEKPKTKASQRTVPMVPQLADILLTHSARMQAEGHPGLQTGWIFPNAKGGLHKGTPLNPVLRKALTDAGVDTRVTVHGLRRTFNDLARRVAAAQVVRSIVGHVTETMTEHYSVVDATEKQAVQAAVLRMLEQSPNGTEEGEQGEESSTAEDGEQGAESSTAEDGEQGAESSAAEDPDRCGKPSGKEGADRATDHAGDRSPDLTIGEEKSPQWEDFGEGRPFGDEEEDRKAQ